MRGDPRKTYCGYRLDFSQPPSEDVPTDSEKTASCHLRHTTPTEKPATARHERAEARPPKRVPQTYDVRWQPSHTPYTEHQSSEACQTTLHARLEAAEPTHWARQPTARRAAPTARVDPRTRTGDQPGCIITWQCRASTPAAHYGGREPAWYHGSAPVHRMVPGPGVRPRSQGRGGWTMRVAGRFRVRPHGPTGRAPRVGSRSGGPTQSWFMAARRGVIHGGYV